MNKIIDICTFYPKSKIKAGEGMTHGRFPFYTSSNTLNKYLNSYQIEEDGIILGTGGNASIHYCSGRFSASTDCLVICSKNPDIYNEYLYYYLLNSIHILENGFRGAGLKHISKKYIEDIEINYIPDVNIQKKIINIINKSKILINKRKEQIEALDELVKSQFIEMFGDPIINNNNYEVKNLDEICLKITDGTHNSPPNTMEGIPYITAKHLKQYGLDFYSDPTYVAIEDHETIYKRCNPEKGDVLYIKDGATTGIAGINNYDFEFSMLSSLALLKLKTDVINNYYLVKYLNNESVKDRIISDMVGGAIKRLTLVRIKNIKVIVPPIELQNQFAEFVKQVDKLKFEMEKSLKELEDNFNSLMQKAFKGELFN